MAGEQLVRERASSAASSARNPFRASWSGPGFSYSLREEAKKISSESYRVYQGIFESACSESYYIPDDVAITVVRLSGLHDIQLEDLWDDALSASYQPSLPGGSREGFLNRDEFFILLALLQTKLRMDDGLFQQRFVANKEPDAVRAIPSTTGEQREGIRTPDHSQQTQMTINRKPLRRGQVNKPRSISGSLGSDRRQVTTPNHEETYADGFTEYHSPTFQSPSPMFNVVVDDTGSGKQPQPWVPSSWVCPKCTYPNLFDSLACNVCEFPRDQLSRDEIQGSSTTPTTSIRQQNSLQEPVGGMGYKEAVRVSPSVLPEVVTSTLPEVVLPSTLPEVVIPSTLPEVVPQIESGLEPVASAKIRNNRQKFSVDEIDAPIATKDSDAQALALITAQEPLKPQLKKNTLSIRRLGRSVLSGSKKSEKSENPPSDPDLAASGFSLGGLAKILGDAAEAGNLPLVSSILKLGADVNYSSRKEEVYHYAATRAVTSKNDDVVEYLLSKGMNKKSAANALHQAIRGNCTYIALKLVPHADLNLMWAVKGERDKTQESCLGALARMNDERNQNRLQLLRLMMEQPTFDADKPAMLLESASGKVALSILSCFTQRTGFATVESLLAQLGDTYKVPRQQRYGSRYVHIDPLACISSEYWQQEPKHALELARLLLKHGSRLTGIEAKYTPLVPAIVGGCVSGARLFLDMGADPECVMCAVGWSTPLSPLSYAAQEPSISIEISRALVYKGAKPTRSDEQGRTALYWACRGGNLEAMNYLLMLDVARSNINKCLEAAIDSNNPEVARELLKIGACATAVTWKHVMSVKPIGSQRNTYLEIIDILLSTKTKLPRELVLDAIDHYNFWALTRILETRNGVVDFDKDALFVNPRWSGIVCRASRSFGPRSKKYGPGMRKDLQTCLAYAEEKHANDIVALLKSYGWENKAECEADCAMKLWKEACESTPPHRVLNCYTIEIGDGEKSAG